MPMNDVFTPGGFNLLEMAAAINKIPTQWSLLDSMNLFPVRGVTTRTVVLEQRNGTLTLLQTKPVGAPPTEGKVDKRTLDSIVIPHIPYHDVVLPEEVQGIREFGTNDTSKSLATAVAEKLQRMKNNYAATLEHLRFGALKGIILDADGSTLYNLYTKFGIAQKTIAMGLADDATEMLTKTMDINDHIEENLKGASSNGMYMALCSSGFFRAFVTHPKVKDAFKYYQANGQNLASDYRGGFVFGDIVWKQYLGSFNDASGVARPLIAANEAHVFPLGTTGVFETLVAPGNFNETANTRGQLLYAKTKEKDFGQGWEIYMESNPLPICYRPEVLVKLTF